VTADGIAEPQYVISARFARAEAHWLEVRPDPARSEAELADDPTAMALRDSAEEQRLREALDVFTGLGAVAAARITRQKMRQLGIRSIPAGRRPATCSNPLGLTRRVREVLA
jgi:hypothetical protein